MGIQVTLPDAREMIERCIRAKLVPMLTGSPGGGKSAVVNQMAADFNLKVIDLRLAQCDPTDLLGFPRLSEIEQLIPTEANEEVIYVPRNVTRASYAPMITFPIEGDPVPEGYGGWLLFLDEFNSADKGVQKAAYKLVLDRMIGEFNLHKQVAIVCAGNLETDNAIVEEMSTALQSRMIHMQMKVDHVAWLHWARRAGIDHRITSYIQFKPEVLMQFKPDHEDQTFACPRTWEFSSRLIHGKDKLELIDKNLLAGTISEGVAREFYGFTAIYQDLPTISQITNSPATTAVPSEPSVLFAITGFIGANATEHNIENLLVFISRLPREFQVITLREINRRNYKMTEHPAVIMWIQKNTDLY